MPAENVEAGRSGSSPPNAARLPGPELMDVPSAVVVIATLLVFYTLYFAAALVVPIACAMVLALLLGPLVQALERFYLPRPLAAVLVVFASVGVLGAAFTMLAAPAESWIERAPQGLQRLEQRFEPLRRKLQSISQVSEKLQQGAQPSAGNEPQKVVVVRPAMLDLVLGTPHVMAPVFSVFMLMFLLLVAGDAFLRKLIGVLPTFKEKKRTVEIIRAMEDDISYYLRMFAGLNLGIGVAMGLVTYLLGIPNPVLWGTLVAILNCVPYVGPMLSMAMLTVVGMTMFEHLSMALAAPVIMLVLSLFSAQVATPLLLGRGLRLNPVAIFMSIMLWGWLWGIVGVLLAVPMLAAFKIVCERIEPLAPLAEFLTLYDRPDEAD